MSTLPASSKHFKSFLEKTRESFEKHRKLLKWSSEPESILELGIGNGTVTKEVIFPLIPQNIKEYIGCDKFDFPLKIAIETVGHEKFKTYQMDASTKNIPEEFKNRFHHIFSNNLFHHVQDIRQVLTNIWEMLKPGGQLFFNAFQKIITDGAYDKLDEGKWSKYENRKGISPFYKSKDPVKEYEDLIKNIGFVNCNIYTDHTNLQMNQTFFEELITYVNYRLPFVEEEDKEEYLRDYKDEVKKIQFVKITEDEKTGEKIFNFTIDTICGVISKPL